MRVLFISRAKVNGISPIVRNQGASLNKMGIDVSYLTLNGASFTGYLRNIVSIKRHLKSYRYDVIHAHYSYVGIVSAIALFPRRIIVSLMGSDTKANRFTKLLLHLFSSCIWAKTIVKSSQMSIGLSKKNTRVIPNGVDFAVYKPYQKDEAMGKVGFDGTKKHVVFFLSHADRVEKNSPLAIKAMNHFDDKEVDFHIVPYIQPDLVPFVLNAADVLLLTSYYEGSPNIVKEAMACCTPIVSTKVGDVQRIVTNTEGCYLCSYEVSDVVDKIQLALSFGGRTSGRENITYLDSKIISQQLISLYKEAL